VGLTRALIHSGLIGKEKGGGLTQGEGTNFQRVVVMDLRECRNIIALLGGSSGDMILGVIRETTYEERERGKIERGLRRGGSKWRNGILRGDP